MVIPRTEGGAFAVYRNPWGSFQDHPRLGCTQYQLPETAWKWKLDPGVRPTRASRDLATTRLSLTPGRRVTTVPVSTAVPSPVPPQPSPRDQETSQQWKG